MRIEPDEPEQYDVSDTEDVTVNGEDAELVTGSITTCTGPGPECIEVQVPYVHLVWERRDGQWVELSGSGRYDDGDRLRAVAEDLVDRPQPVPLQVHLAPAGLVGPGLQGRPHPHAGQRLLRAADGERASSPFPRTWSPADALLGELMGPVGPVIPATINGRPAQLVQIGGGPMDSGWYLQAQFTDGTTFVVQAPAAFTQEEVLRFAGEVTYTP